MYWPVGAPRIYAASNSKSAKELVLASDDDAESRETIEGSSSSLEALNIAPDGRQDNGHDVGSGATTPVIPSTPGIKPVEHDIHGRPHSQSVGSEAVKLGPVDKEPLLSLKISRIGHLFAVITSTSLTIWQTKVTIPLRLICSFLILACSLLLY